VLRCVRVEVCTCERWGVCALGRGYVRAFAWGWVLRVSRTGGGVSLPGAPHLRGRSSRCVESVRPASTPRSPVAPRSCLGGPAAVRRSGRWRQSAGMDARPCVHTGAFERSGLLSPIRFPRPHGRVGTIGAAVPPHPPNLTPHPPTPRSCMQSPSLTRWR